MLSGGQQTSPIVGEVAVVDATAQPFVGISDCIWNRILINAVVDLVEVQKHVRVFIERVLLVIVHSFCRIAFIEANLLEIRFVFVVKFFFYIEF